MSSGWIAEGPDTSFNGYTDGFVVKLSGAGQFLWGTYLGGTTTDLANAIAIDGTNNIYVTGETGSSGWIQGGAEQRPPIGRRALPTAEKLQHPAPALRDDLRTAACSHCSPRLTRLGPGVGPRRPLP